MKIWSSVPYFTETWNSKFAVLLRSYLSSKRVLLHYKISKIEWQILLEKIYERIQKSLSQPGESVGIVSAQSSGECITQLTLNIFHQAGNSEKNITLGVPRIKEISGFSKKTKTPSMTIYLLPCISKNKSIVKFIAKNIVHVCLADVIADIRYEQSLYSPLWYFNQILENHPKSLLDFENDSLDFSRMLFDYIPDILPNKQVTYSEYSCILFLEKAKLCERKISVQKIAKGIQQKYGNALLIKIY